MPSRVPTFDLKQRSALMRAALKRNPPDVVSARALERKALHELEIGRASCRERV